MIPLFVPNHGQVGSDSTWLVSRVTGHVRFVFLSTKINIEERYRQKLLIEREMRLARPERLELPTLWFEARCSIQLSYGRAKPLYPST